MPTLKSMLICSVISLVLLMPSLGFGELVNRRGSEVAKPQKSNWLLCFLIGRCGQDGGSTSPQQTANPESTSLYPFYTEDVQPDLSLPPQLLDKDLVRTTCDPNQSRITIANYQPSKRGYSCQPSQIVSSMATFIDEHLGSCVEEALGKAGVDQKPQHIEIHSLGTIASRVVNTGGKCKGQSLGNAPSGCSASYHSTGRAIDISGLKLTIAGKDFHFPLSCVNKSGRTQSGFNSDCSRKNDQRGLFYDAFNLCWANRVKAYNNKNQIGCSDGIIDCDDNALHKDHIHLSLPYCPRVPGIASK